MIMSQSHLRTRNRIFRKTLVCMLTLTTLLLFTVFATPAVALSPGDTIYLTAGEHTIASAKATFKDESGGFITSDTGNTDGFIDMSYDTQKGVFWVEIPSGAEKVYFNVSFTEEGVSQDQGFNPMQLSNCDGNAYDIVAGAWYNLDSQQPTPPPEDTTPETTDETGRVSYTDMNGGKTQTITPSGDVGSVDTSVEVVSVDLSWQAMEFTYTPSSKGTWNPNTHSYDGGSEASWSSTSNQITVTNHSNVGITTSFAFQSEEDLGLRGEFRNESNQTVESLNLESAENPNGGVGNAVTKTVTFHITSGSISEKTDSLGTITVRIDKISE